MTQPTPYNKSRTFADSSTGVVYPVPASFLDTEFTNVERTLDEICTNLALIQRDDGLLANQSVHPDSLTEATLAMIGEWNPRGDWATSQKYSRLDMVRENGLNYVAVQAHTSGTFNTDLTAGYWQALGTPNSILQVQLDALEDEVGSQGQTLSAFMLSSIEVLRGYQGPATSAGVVSGAAFGDALGGDYAVKPGDTTTPDNNRRTIVDAIGRRWWQIDKSAHLLNVGIPSFTTGESETYVQDGGGLNIGGPTGVWVRQEGRPSDYEDGSLAMYPRVPNRWCGLSIAPSCIHPADLPTQNITSLGLQILNGEGSEERLILSTHWLSPGNPAGNGEARIGMYKTGVSTSYRPLRFYNNESFVFEVNPDRSTAFTNQHISGASGGNTSVNFKHPTVAGGFRAFVRATDGLVGFERLTNGSPDYEMRFKNNGVEIASGMPTLWLNETDLTANNKKWLFDAFNGTLRGLLANDAENSFSNWLNVYRNGAAFTNISFGGDYLTAPLQVDATGVGFFATAPVAKQTVTGSRGGNAALASLLTALAAMGLITNSSS